MDDRFIPVLDPLRRPPTRYFGHFAQVARIRRGGWHNPGVTEIDEVPRRRGTAFVAGPRELLATGGWPAHLAAAGLGGPAGVGDAARRSRAVRRKGSVHTLSGR
jgi:hypothetical protein